jgi:hypothetical protein
MELFLKFYCTFSCHITQYIWNQIFLFFFFCWPWSSLQSSKSVLQFKGALKIIEIYGSVSHYDTISNHCCVSCSWILLLSFLWFPFAVSCHFLQLLMCHSELIYIYIYHVLSITFSSTNTSWEPDNPTYHSYVQRASRGWEVLPKRKLHQI